MQTNMQRKGFTLIELLVVIVIIGILATISVATFSGYFKKARDSERQAAVRNSATLLKTARAVESITGYGEMDAGTATDAAKVAAVLSDEGGYSMPAASASGYNFSYVAASDDFAIFVCKEEGGIFVDGTATAVAAVKADAATICPASGPTAALMLTAVDADGDSTDDTPINITGS